MRTVPGTIGSLAFLRGAAAEVLAGTSSQRSPKQRAETANSYRRYPNRHARAPRSLAEQQQRSLLLPAPLTRMGAEPAAAALQPQLSALVVRPCRAPLQASARRHHQAGRARHGLRRLRRDWHEYHGDTATAAGAGEAGRTLPLPLTLTLTLTLSLTLTLTLTRCWPGWSARSWSWQMTASCRLSSRTRRR